MHGILPSRIDLVVLYTLWVLFRAQFAKCVYVK